MIKKISFIGLAFILLACGSNPKKYSNGLAYALDSNNKKISRVLDHLDQHQVQILYTRITQDASGKRLFTSYEFQIDSLRYFYPASSVKLLAAALSLEKLEMLGRSHKNLFRLADTVADSIADQNYSFDRDINEIFAISSNDTYNRLFEFLGTDHINKSLAAKGLSPIRISHRLSTPNAAHSKTLAISLLNSDQSSTLFPSITNQVPKNLVLEGIKKGSGYYENGELVREPFDFSLKNFYPIQAQQDVLKRIMFPEDFKEGHKFNMGTEKLAFLQKAMQLVPRKLGYNEKTYYDSYGKFFMFGDTQDRIPEYIQIFNKVGYAYGTLTDNAYIHDHKNNISFMLTATILVNENGIFNDNVYEYDTLGIPFLAQLGREIYDYEKYLQRKQ